VPASGLILVNSCDFSVDSRRLASGYRRDRYVRIRNDDLLEQSDTAERQQTLFDVVQHGVDFVAEYGG
jgi:hypothetical protein